MKKLLKWGATKVIARCYAMKTTKDPIIMDPKLEKVLEKHKQVFEELPKDILPKREHDHAIDIIAWSNPPNIKPYRYPYQQIIEIERLV